MAYSGKTAPNSTSQMDSVSWTPKAPTTKATIGGTMNDMGAKGADISRSSSPNAPDVKLFEKRSDAPTK